MIERLRLKNVHLLCFKFHKINPDRGGSYIDSLRWIKNKKWTKDRINKKDEECFQYAVTVALNHEKIGKNPEIISKTKSFMHKHNWEVKNFSSEKDECANLKKLISQSL